MVPFPLLVPHPLSVAHVTVFGKWGSIVLLWLELGFRTEPPVPAVCDFCFTLELFLCAGGGDSCVAPGVWLPPVPWKWSTCCRASGVLCHGWASPSQAAGLSLFTTLPSQLPLSHPRSSFQIFVDISCLLSSPPRCPRSCLWHCSFPVVLMRSGVGGRDESSRFWVGFKVPLKQQLTGHLPCVPLLQGGAHLYSGVPHHPRTLLAQHP